MPTSSQDRSLTIDITLLGVGEAFDPAEPNSSALVEADGYTLLIDCGHSAVAPFWRTCPAPDTVDAIYLTHHHADHVLGLIPVLDRWAYDGRRKPLDIVTSDAGATQLQALLAAGFVPVDNRSPSPSTSHRRSTRAASARSPPRSHRRSTLSRMPLSAWTMPAEAPPIAAMAVPRPTPPRSTAASTCCCTSASCRSAGICRSIATCLPS